MSAAELATRPISALPFGTSFARYVMVKALAAGDAYQELALAERFKDSPQVRATINLLQTKAAVAVGTTSDATWAGPLSTYGISGEALAAVRGQSILGALESKMRRVPFKTRVAKETGATSGSWIGEGLATPATAAAYSSLSQDAYKAAVICVMSDELLKLGDPDVEKTVRETIASGVAAFLDSQFLTSTVTLSAGLRPASVTNGTTAVVSTGSTAAAINADLASMLALISTDGGGLTWVMRPTTAYKIAATIGGTAAADIPRTLFGIPLVLSINSPQQVTLIDAGHVLYSDNGAIDISISTQAALEMNDAPTNPPTAATVIESLWPRNLFGVRVTRWIAWLRAQSGAVVYMSVSY